MVLPRSLSRFAGGSGTAAAPKAGAARSAAGGGATDLPQQEGRVGVGSRRPRYSMTIFGPADPRAATFSRSRAAIFW
jgi:hypothetical protein